MAQGPKKHKHPKTVPYRNYIEGSTDGLDGRVLKEPVPDYSTRNGDAYITATKFENSKGVDNNAIIVFGRNRVPNSRGHDYSNHMGAGAIDIVVGRGAPYCLEQAKTSESGEAVPHNYPPYFVTQHDEEAQGKTLAEGTHDGKLMDAARIYITQMAEIDDHFKFYEPPGNMSDETPCSAIVLKADRCRIHARRDVKIIGGGDLGGSPVNYDSNGYSINETGKVHLIAGNGFAPYEVKESASTPDALARTAYGPQQHIPRGENLVECLKEMLTLSSQIVDIVNNFIIDQKAINALVSNHVHGTGVGPTTQDPICQIGNIMAEIGAVNNLINNFGTNMVNIPRLRFRYLDSSGQNYILSRYNTTN